MTKTLNLKSTAFGDNAMIPSKYTCEGENTIPPLQISGVPAGTKSLAIILDDPDTAMGIFTHWVVWNIPPETNEITESKEPAGLLGKGSSGKLGYIGPCPPTGTHHYIFKLYALDAMLSSLPEGSNKKDLEDSMSGHILDQTELVGLYKKKL